MIFIYDGLIVVGGVGSFTVTSLHYHIPYSFGAAARLVELFY